MTAARGDLHFSATQSGALASAFFIGYIASQFPSGFLADRVGYRRVILGALIVMAPFITAMSFVQTFGVGVLLMALTGVGAGAVFSAGVKAVTTWFGEERRVTGLSMFQLGAPAGVLLANVSPALDNRTFRLAQRLSVRRRRMRCRPPGRMAAAQAGTGSAPTRRTSGPGPSRHRH